MKTPHAFLELQHALPDSGELNVAHLSENVRKHMKALRLRNGETLYLLDGRGGRATLDMRDERQGLLSVRKREQVPALQPDLRLYLSPPKGDALAESITQATEIGATQIHFVHSEHTQHKNDAKFPFERLQRVADAALEQCARPWRCQIGTRWHSLREALAGEALCVFADEGLAAQNVMGFGATAPKLNTEPIKIFVGPEGGWSDQERALLREKATALGLGSLILRTPTAVVAALHTLRSLYLRQ